MDSANQDCTVSSTTTSPNDVHENETEINNRVEIQVNTINSTTSSDLEAVLQSLLGFD